MEAERLDMINVEIASQVLAELSDLYRDKQYDLNFKNDDDLARLALAIQHGREMTNAKYKPTVGKTIAASTVDDGTWYSKQNG